MQYKELQYALLNAVEGVFHVKRATTQKKFLAVKFKLKKIILICNKTQVYFTKLKALEIQNKIH